MEAERQNAIKGTVVQERAGFFVKAGRDKIPLGSLIEESQVKEMVGREVEVLYSDSSMRSVIGIQARMSRCYFILCYYPAPIWRVFKDDRWRVILDDPVPITEQLRIKIADRLLKENIIAKDVHERIIG